MGEPTLRILSVYEALDGEANAFHQGSWTVFVRTAGCTVGCAWCDTMYSWSAKRGKDYTIPELIGEIAKVGKSRKVTLTGGEPLEQDQVAVAELLRELTSRGYRVTIETAGTEPVGWLKSYHPWVSLVLDYKLQSAQAKRPNIQNNFHDLGERHFIKFVLETERDYQEMILHARRLRSPDTQCFARMVMSPIFPIGRHESSFTLQEWVTKMKADELSSLQIGLSVQLHKLIYPNDAREEESGGVDHSSVHK